jgi:YHS domain-containing protein
MKFRIIAGGLILASVWCISACNESPRNQNAMEEQHKHESHNHMEGSGDKDAFSHIEFASAYDTICGMPLKAGIADTLLVDGKIYGFCATECKDSFKVMLAEKK